MRFFMTDGPVAFVPLSGYQRGGYAARALFSGVISMLWKRCCM